MLAAAWIAVLFSQAEPAPHEPAAPVFEATQAPPPTGVGFSAGVGYRLRPASRDLPPALGFSLATLIAHRYALLGPLELSLAAHLGYDRHSRGVQASRPISPTEETTYDGIRGISVFDFCALQTASLVIGRWRPWLAAGAGLTLAHFRTEELQLRPGESRSTRLVLQAAAGIDVQVSGPAYASLRVDVHKPVAHPTFVTDTGERLRVFGDRLAARLGMFYRF